MRDKDTGLHADGEKLFFNKKDITKEADEMVADYLHEDWERLGWMYGATLNQASKNDDALFLY